MTPLYTKQDGYVSGGVFTVSDASEYAVINTTADVDVAVHVKDGDESAPLVIGGSVVTTSGNTKTEIRYPGIYKIVVPSRVNVDVYIDYVKGGV